MNLAELWAAMAAGATYLGERWRLSCDPHSLDRSDAAPVSVRQIRFGPTPEGASTNGRQLSRRHTSPA